MEGLSVTVCIPGYGRFINATFKLCYVLRHMNVRSSYM